MSSQLIDIISQLKVKDLVKLANDFGFETKGLVKQDLVDILQTIPSLYSRVPVDAFDLTKKAKSELTPLTNTPRNTPRSSVSSLEPIRTVSTKKALLLNIIPLLKLDDLRMIAGEFFIKTRGILKQELEDILLELPYSFLQKEYEISQFDLTKANLMKLKLYSVPKTPLNSPF
jgi:hypothetical protein